jgi:hypothetical protein
VNLTRAPETGAGHSAAQASDRKRPGECINEIGIQTPLTRKTPHVSRDRARDLSRIVAHVRRRYAPLRGKAEIGLAVGAVIGRHEMGKHYELTITDDSFTYRRKPESIAREAKLDGVYVVRTSMPAETLSADEAVRAYKDLARWSARSDP